MMKRMMKRQKNMMKKTTSKHNYEETQLVESMFELGTIFILGSSRLRPSSRSMKTSQLRPQQGYSRSPERL